MYTLYITTQGIVYEPHTNLHTTPELIDQLSELAAQSI